ncbi:E3 ubiquitin ligase complex SCF subunit sconB [Penicillium chermesinum]|uniref:Probable E3 ubiquitin ligase complex SCF subunit sconB n=1 Tax=Penicillium chermesinum TaxID=63820 RepID=A0A9W9NQA1_9EURO|nr:E3 ubiquitin ligase complex SCF subunit sconB [Penicillium chermesinum]KAJ5224006.1 E3 ubiquitin ligase complex SCF subunit sconB [Penicillium chermesinum]
MSAVHELVNPTPKEANPVGEPASDPSTPHQTDTSENLAEMAKKKVAPFLIKHQPRQYAPLTSDDGTLTIPRSVNSGYCYRHKPDSKCSRQADEQSMRQLQQQLETLPQDDQQGISHLNAASPSFRSSQLACANLSGSTSSAPSPPELSFKILRYLDTASLCRAAQVSPRWRALADDDVTRKRLREAKREIELRASNWGNHAPAEPADGAPNGTCSVVELPTPGHKRKISLQEQDESCDMIKRHCKSPAYRSERPETDEDYYKTRYRPWKDVYRDRFIVGLNWKHRRCTQKIFRGHTDSVMCLQFEDNILMTGSYDATVKIWDMETGEELRTLKGHSAGVRCLQFDDTKLITGSLDRSVRVWNWRTGECISRYNGHSEAVIALHFDSTLLASASVDRTVKIWNFKDKSTFVLPHPGGVNSVKIDISSRTALTACDDGAARLWDLDTKTCIQVFHNHIGAVQQAIPLPREIELENHFEECENDHNSTSSQNGDVPPNIISPVLQYKPLSSQTPLI